MVFSQGGGALHPREAMFSCSLSGPVPSEGSFEPEWRSKRKTAGGMTNGFDFKEVCFVGAGAEAGRAGWLSLVCLPVLSHDRLGHWDFTVSVWVYLSHALSKKKHQLDLATCFLWVTHNADSVQSTQVNSLGMS